MLHKLMGGLDMSENGMAMESLRNVPTDGHHLGTPHTMANFRTAFHRSDLFDYNSYEQWRDEGQQSAAQVANGRYKKLLREYTPPELDPGLEEALQAFITRRKAEIKPEF
jgi:trimethylamine--corrinoid protein Co-methyltransferase